MDIRKIHKLLKNNCHLRFNANNIASPLGDGSGPMYSTIDNYRPANTVFGESLIQITGIKSGAFDTVNVVYEGGHATKGKIIPPGYIYSDGFSGCVFYLYRGVSGEVWGVHAARASGKLADPALWFQQHGYQQLYKWDSSGQLSDEMRLQYYFGTVFACVDHHEIAVFSLVTKNQQVHQISKVEHLLDWKTALASSEK